MPSLGGVHTKPCAHSRPSEGDPTGSLFFVTQPDDMTMPDTRWAAHALCHAVAGRPRGKGGSPVPRGEGEEVDPVFPPAARTRRRRAVQAAAPQACNLRPS